MSDSSSSTTPELRLCHLSEIPAGTAKSFELDGRLVSVFHTRNGQIVATEGRCPHKGGPLADGMIVNQQIVCPLHGAGFSLVDGTCDRPELRPLCMFPVRVQNEWIILGLVAKVMDRIG